MTPMAANARGVKELFSAALDLPDPAVRAAFLDAQCGADAELRQRLELLLVAHDAPASALERPLAAEHTGAHTSGERLTTKETPGTLIAGHYKLLQEIGTGGMGS